MKKNEPLRELLCHSLKKTLLIMRIAVVLLLFGFLQIHANNAYSQKTRLSINFSDTKLVNVLDQIENETEFLFLYNEKLIDPNRKVSIHVQDQGIEDILKLLFTGTDVEYSILDRKIILSPSENPSTTQQQKSIAGKVTDTSGAPLPGVSVVVKGTTQGTISDADGNYSLSNVSSDGTLVFSFVGMKTQEILVAGKLQINVILEEEVFDVDEVVVVGYGTQKKSDITGSIATVKVDELVTQPTSDFQGMLKGKVPGLYVTVKDARPGGSSDVLLRGVRSLKGGNAPLYVVDGVAISSINEINIDDVESISILKDASSQAIYGARASNGVILITTKRGSNTGNKVEVSYHGYCSIQNVNPNFEIFSPEEYIQLRREAYRGDLATAENGWIGTYPDDEQMFTPLELDRIATKNYVNWTDYAFKKDVPLTKHDISLVGGNEFTKYSASLDYYYQDGIRYSSDLTKYSGRLTLDQKISETFKTGLSVYYTTYTQNQETNTWTDFITFSPLSQIYDENGELVLYPTGDGKSVNPLMYEKTRNYEYKAERIIVNGYLEVTPAFLPGLKYKLNANLNSRNRETHTFMNKEDRTYLTKGYASINFYTNKDYLVENILTYNKTIKDKHKLDVTVMQSIEPQYAYSTTSTATLLGNDFFGINSLNTALESAVARSSTERKMVSFMGRINYAFLEKYLLSFTVRADGSSVFGANNKWGYFPSAAVAWNLHKESFMKDTGWLNEAKVRISYGQIGNQAIDPYGSLATADNAFYVSNGSTLVGYLPGTSLPNPDLRWEVTTTLNTGVDFGVLNQRLSGSIEYYKSNTKHLLVDRSLPTVLGYSKIPTNLGEIQNTGIEVSLTGFIVSNNDLTWSVTANFSKNKNKLVKGVLQDPITGEYIDDVSNKWFIGEPVNVSYNYKFAGIWQLDDDIVNSPQPNARPGDVKVADLYGPDGVPDGKITPEDRTIYYRDPKWMGSLSTHVNFKGIEISADLYTVQGTIRQNVFLSDYNYGGAVGRDLNGIRRDYWTPENPSNTTYRPHVAAFTDYMGLNSYQDASYIRLRNITLAYNLPQKWVKEMGLSRVKVYVAGDNLWTKTDYLSYSPEADADDYPETKNYTFGININF
ncbi:MAG: TonB-dependent receptor [Mangrovibacterium sp.]